MGADDSIIDAHTTYDTGCHKPRLRTRHPILFINN
jgi:hypothetical protein